MTARLPLEEAVLTHEQWDHVEALARSLTPMQARWISGYFAGLEAGLPWWEGEGQVALAPSPGRALTILYGTETGNSREVATTLAATARERGITPKLSDLADYKVRQLKDEQDVLCIVSTYGEGDPPQSAMGFFEFLEGARAPRLEGVRYAVLALGDSTYEKYCEAGKRIDRRLAELGATRLHDRVDCDLDYEDAAALWSQSLLDSLVVGLDDSLARARAVIRSASQTQAHARRHDKRHPFPATVLENIRIVGRHSTKETRHVELDLSGSGLTYRPGDALGLVATNNPALVEQFVNASGLAAHAPVTIKGETLPLAEALERKLEITTATPRFLERWAQLSEAADLVRLAAPDATAERLAFLERHHLIDILHRYPVRGIDVQTLIDALRPLQPRLYSIASSQAAVGDEVHLTVAPVRYALHGSQRGGVASTYIADRLGTGSTVPVYVQENAHFRLPADDVPIIMVGPGTGVAPFRAFLQERESRAARGRSWLFFGERNLRSDFLYQTEWQAWRDAGHLSRLDVAFSRDGSEKVYVQHRMREQARDLYAWLEDGAHLYVCGDAKAMASDVHEALVAVIECEGALSRDAAEDYLDRLVAEHRYQRDVY